MHFVSGFRVIGGFSNHSIQTYDMFKHSVWKRMPPPVTLSSDFDLKGRFHELQGDAISYLEQWYTNPMVHSEDQLKHSPWSIIHPFSSKIQHGDMPRLGAGTSPTLVGSRRIMSKFLNFATLGLRFRFTLETELHSRFQLQDLEQKSYVKSTEK